MFCTTWRTPQGGYWRTVSELHDGVTSPFGTKQNTTSPNTWSELQTNHATKTSWDINVNIGSGIAAAGALSSATDKTLYLPTTGRRNRDSGDTELQNTNGAYWSSSAVNSTLGHSVSFTITNVHPSGGDYYADSFAVRCVR